MLAVFETLDDESKMRHLSLVRLPFNATGTPSVRFLTSLDAG
jgi:hypothetical protein